MGGTKGIPQEVKVVRGDPESSGRVRHVVVVGKGCLPEAVQMAKKCSPKVLTEKRPSLRPRQDDVEGDDSTVSNDVVSKFGDVGLEDLCVNLFDIVCHIADFSTKLQEADRQPGQGDK